MMPFGQAVLLWRLERGLTQDVLARRARVPRPNLSAIERGTREVSLKTVRALAQALDIRPGVLVDGLSPRQKGKRSLSRKALEQIADGVVHGIPLADVEQRRLAQLIRRLVVHRHLASQGTWRAPAPSGRRANRSWLQLTTMCSPETIASLLARIADREHGS